MKGLRLRFASPTIREFVAALGGTPVGVLPTEQVEQLQKGTIDGTFIDYGGAGIAFKMGGLLKYSTEMYSYVSSFGVVHEPGLLGQAAAGPASAGDEIDDRRRKGGRRGLGRARRRRQEALIMDGGAEPIKLSAEENAKFRKIGAEVAEAQGQGARRQGHAGDARSTPR